MRKPLLSPHYQAPSTLGLHPEPGIFEEDPEDVLDFEDALLWFPAQVLACVSLQPLPLAGPRLAIQKIVEGEALTPTFLYEHPVFADPLSSTLFPQLCQGVGVILQSLSSPDLAAKTPHLGQYLFPLETESRKISTEQRILRPFAGLLREQAEGVFVEQVFYEGVEQYPSCTAIALDTGAAWQKRGRDIVFPSPPYPSFRDFIEGGGLEAVLLTKDLSMTYTSCALSPALSGRGQLNVLLKRAEFPSLDPKESVQ